MRIVHLTSVHEWNDNRIFYKECKTLAKQGYNVVLIGVAEREMIVDGIRIIPLPRIGNKIKRMFVNSFLILKQSIKANGNIYHFHDPELVFVGLFLRIIGKQVIYDIHENIIEVIKGRSYWSNNIKKWLPLIAGIIEKWSAQFFHLIIAGDYLDKRYPRSIKILNYPELMTKQTIFKENEKIKKDVKGLVYTGFIAERRGALIYATIAKQFPDLPVYLIGECRPLSLFKRLKKIAGRNTKFLIEGKGRFVDPKKMDSLLHSGNWLAALCIFPYSDQYLYTQPTKLFEYMAYGIPVICSNFPAWEQLLVKNRCGISVDPADSIQIADKINWLISNPDDANRMGKRGREAFLDRYNWEIESKKLIKLYNDILSGLS